MVESGRTSNILISSISIVDLLLDSWITSAIVFFTTILLLTLPEFLCKQRIRRQRQQLSRRRRLNRQCESITSKSEPTNYPTSFRLHAYVNSPTSSPRARSTKPYLVHRALGFLEKTLPASWLHRISAVHSINRLSNPLAWLQPTWTSVCTCTTMVQFTQGRGGALPLSLLPFLVFMLLLLLASYWNPFA